MNNENKPIVVLTGATGFIGSALIRHLSPAYTVVALDRAGPPEPDAPAHSVVFDLGSDRGVTTAIAQVREQFGKRIAAVVHLAAYYDVSGESNPLYDKVNVLGTQRLIDALQDLQVEQFIYASTMLVHEPTDRPDVQINEDSPIAPAWAYPESKVQVEAVLRERHGDIPLVLLLAAPPARKAHDQRGNTAPSKIENLLLIRAPPHPSDSSGPRLC